MLKKADLWTLQRKQHLCIWSLWGVCLIDWAGKVPIVLFVSCFWNSPSLGKGTPVAEDDKLEIHQFPPQKSVVLCVALYDRGSRNHNKEKHCWFITPKNERRTKTSDAFSLLWLKWLCPIDIQLHTALQQSNLIYYNGPYAMGVLMHRLPINLKQLHWILL